MLTIKNKDAKVHLATMDPFAFIQSQTSTKTPIFKVACDVDWRRNTYAWELLNAFIDKHDLGLVYEIENIEVLNPGGKTVEEGILMSGFTSDDEKTVLIVRSRENSSGKQQVEDLQLYTTVEDLADEMRQLVFKVVRVTVPPTPVQIRTSARIHMLALGMMGPELIPSLLEPREINPKFYSEGVVQGFEDALREKRPGLIFLSGEMGTGKTNLIRHCATKLKDEMRFVFCPHSQISIIMDPKYTMRLIHVLKGAVLILEDGEGLFATRQESSPSSGVTSLLLNLTDGFMGDLTGLKIVATQNVAEDVDKAFLRPGRLLYKHEFGKLPVEQCKEIGEIISVTTEGAEKITEPMTLAELFALPSSKPLTVNTDSLDSENHDEVESEENMFGVPEKETYGAELTAEEIRSAIARELEEAA